MILGWEWHEIKPIKQRVRGDQGGAGKRVMIWNMHKPCTPL
jgi:hypothetical protein